MEYGDYLWLAGRFDEGIATLRHGERLDPFYIDRLIGTGFALRYARRYDEAIQEFQKALVLDPLSAVSVFHIAAVYEDLGDRDRAVAEYERYLGMALRPERAARDCTLLQNAYVAGGWLGFWRAELSLADEEFAKPGAVWRPPYHASVSSLAMSRRFARLGMNQKALTALEDAGDAHLHQMPVISFDPLLEGLRTEPRFQALVKRVGPATRPT
jgi:tetratricopeptide (TPR) repeat protein